MRIHVHLKCKANKKLIYYIYPHSICARVNLMKQNLNFKRNKNDCFLPLQEQHMFSTVSTRKQQCYKMKTH